METLSIGKLTFEQLSKLVQLEEHPMQPYPWTQVSDWVLTEKETLQLSFIADRLLEEPAHLLNEATIWGRAIYPLLLLCEQGEIRARAEVPIAADYPQFKISGIADGALGKTIATRVIAPFLVIVEAKRGIEGNDRPFSSTEKCWPPLASTGNSNPKRCNKRRKLFLAVTRSPTPGLF